MKFTWNGSVRLVAGLILGVGAGACGGATESPETMPAEGGTTSSSGAPSSSSDGGAKMDAAAEGGAGTTNNNGARCKADGECTSGKCWKQMYCTIACPMKDSRDPVCTALGGRFTGHCNRQGFCQMN